VNVQILIGSRSIMTEPTFISPSNFFDTWGYIR